MTAAALVIVAVSSGIVGGMVTLAFLSVIKINVSFTIEEIKEDETPATHQNN